MIGMVLMEQLPFFIIIGKFEVKTMTKFTCPACENESIPLKHKYAMGYWMTRRCGECDSLIANHAIILGVLSFAYLWNLLFFVGLAQFGESLHYLGYMAVIWIILDIINVKYVPLMVIRGR